MNQEVRDHAEPASALSAAEEELAPIAAPVAQRTQAPSPATPTPQATGRAVVITSGKGGVGKTTVTANLGTALADAGKRVVVVDADVGLRNLDVVMGLENRVRRHSLDVIEERCTLDEALVRDRSRRTLALLPAAQDRDKDEMPLDAMRALVLQLQSRFDFVLIDCPAGIEHGFRNAIAGAREAIIVTTPEVSAVRDADRVAGLLPPDMPVKLIVNRIRPHLVKKGTMLTIDDVLDILRLELVGVVPDDKDVIVATNRGAPVVDIVGSQTGAAFRRIASRILGEAIPIPTLQERSAWFSRVLSSLRFPRS
ncbi:MAG: septum site-determining protein MinD [Candidatus Eremiobacteraeota bacterium]|nr:septum site-determining protein MinD [Candidatus Eremiobacteraeota bacterium]